LSVPAARAEAISGAELAMQYQAYRRREARGLIGLLPVGAIRPLYRRALRESGQRPDRDDPMRLLVSYCERILPLPPFEMWLEDRGRFPAQHWDALEGSAEVPSPASPATFDVRTFARDSVEWRACLRGFRDRDVWRGFIAFEDAESGDAVYRTALIFRESEASELRDRFRSFESGTLEAFLRSALP